MKYDWGSTVVVVTDETVGKFLATLREANPGNAYWPRDMRTEEGYQRAVSYFHIVPLLQTVDQHNAYAWLAIEVLTPTWQDYLFPDLSKVLSIAQPPDVMVGLDQRNQTVIFQPMLHKPDSLPASAELCTELPRMMRMELEQIVSQSGRQQSKISERAEESVHSVLQQDDPFMKESDLNGMIVYIRLAVDALCQGLFGDSVPIRFSTGHGEPLILWETKSPSAGEKHMQTMISSQSITFSKDQVKWLNEHAVLAKLAWHAMDCDVKPSWAVIFAGGVYMIVHISYRIDCKKHLRPFLHYSPMIPLYDRTLPIWSTVLYMVVPVESSAGNSLAKMLTAPMDGELSCEAPPGGNLRPISSSLESSDGILVYTEGSYMVPMSRVVDLASKAPDTRLPFLLQVTGRPLCGGSGQFYRFNGLHVFKLA
ncbi:SubName: Full=Uncharacterized protein {ECO:0000313/EMBL:CCA70277.1} [Serendipita indica DSM 11827]|nr:SubName: Full=Uncharacterized protein {ECO:0000313/EMBL:CCA70277.1} [Serendipita indica DSM 11827]